MHHLSKLCLVRWQPHEFFFNTELVGAHRLVLREGPLMGVSEAGDSRYTPLGPPGLGVASVGNPTSA